MQAYRTLVTIFGVGGVVVLLLFGLFSGNAIARAAGPNPGVIPPGSNPFGASYGKWSARWWKWAAAQPKATNPIMDPTGANCGVAQEGPVWFLAGSNSSDKVNRSCTIPEGKALFFPLVNAAEFHEVGDGLDTPELLRNDLLAYYGPIINLHAEIDGVPVTSLNPQHTRYHACAGGASICAGAFAVTLPAKNIFGAAPGVYSPAVDDGVYLMLYPLSAGQHTLKFGGKFLFGGSPFSQRIIYHLMVGSGLH